MKTRPHRIIPLLPVFLAACLLFSGCATTGSEKPVVLAPPTELLNEYLNPEIARFYPGLPVLTDAAADDMMGAAANGDPVARIRLAVSSLSGSAIADPGDELQKAADAGCPDALVIQGQLLYFGSGTDADREKALRLFEEAAAKGSYRAAFELGTLSYRGENRNREQSAAYFRTGAENGYPPAQLALGMQYLNGKGVEKDREKGLALIRAAADSGDPVSAYVLGVFHEEGYHVGPDAGKAESWYRKAAAGGSPQAIEHFEENARKAARRTRENAGKDGR